MQLANLYVPHNVWIVNTQFVSEKCSTLFSALVTFPEYLSKRLLAIADDESTKQSCGS